MYKRLYNLLKIAGKVHGSGVRNSVFNKNKLVKNIIEINCLRTFLLTFGIRPYLYFWIFWTKLSFLLHCSNLIMESVTIFLYSSMTNCVLLVENLHSSIHTLTSC